MNGWGRFALAAAEALGIDAATLPVRAEAPASLPWVSAFPVAELALDSVAFASALLDRAAEARGAGEAAPTLDIDPLRVAASFGSERMLRIDGEAPPVWAPLSGFFPVADGGVRTHANYPAHAARLRAVLGLSADAGVEELKRALAERTRFELEDAAAEAGAIVAAVREAGEWAQHPQCSFSSAGPLIRSAVTGEAPARRWRGSGSRPLEGVRVLDLTRVIAGPIATRDLALAGAEVLRIDDPGRPEISWQHLDTGQLKRTASLDLAETADRFRLDALLAGADVVVTGYRPGALDRFGLAPETLARTHPGLVVGAVSAWGTEGPWAHRRGFDSIVQATIGIARAEQHRAASAGPGALPVQALDHSSGHLLAAAVIDALTRQRANGGSHHVSVALARAGAELMRHSAPAPAGGAESALPSASFPVLDGGTVVSAPPPLAFRGAPETYAFVHRWGTDAARWRSPADATDEPSFESPTL